MRVQSLLVPVITVAVSLAARSVLAFQVSRLPALYTSSSCPSIIRLHGAARASADAPAKVTASDLRAVKVTNAEGEYVPLGRAMGTGTSVVVFLRHLGCTWCWSYVYQWKLIQDELRAAGIEGPIFVSIGDQHRLNSFLIKNPEVSRDDFFVDGYDFAAYKEAGFERFDEKPQQVTENVKPKPAKFGGIKGWWTFMTSFIPLAPVTPDMKLPEKLMPEGLFWVGGTFVVKGNEIIYRWDDRISGDHPEASEVVEIAKQAATSAPFPLSGSLDISSLLSRLSKR